MQIFLSILICKSPFFVDVYSAKNENTENEFILKNLSIIVNVIRKKRQNSYLLDTYNYSCFLQYYIAVTLDIKYMAEICQPNCTNVFMMPPVETAFRNDLHLQCSFCMPTKRQREQQQQQQLKRTQRPSLPWPLRDFTRISDNGSNSNNDNNNNNNNNNNNMIIIITCNNNNEIIVIKIIIIIIIIIMMMIVIIIIIIIYNNNNNNNNDNNI